MQRQSASFISLGILGPFDDTLEGRHGLDRCRFDGRGRDLNLFVLSSSKRLKD